MIDGTLEAHEGRPALRFERRLSHSVDRVWQAVSAPSELEQWFPAAAEWTPAVGEKLEAYGMTGEVLEVEAPHRLAWEFNGDFYSFELVAVRDGCQLTFIYVFDEGTPTAQTAAGWQTSLNRLDAMLAGETLSEQEAHADWGAIHERYAERFGVDPAPGREFWKQLKDSLGLK